MEDIQARLPKIASMICEDIREHNWPEIKSDLESLNWLESGNSSGIFKNYLKLVDSYGLQQLANIQQFSLISILDVGYFINTHIFRERDKQTVKEMVSFAQEFLKTLNFFKIARDILNKKPQDIEVVLKNIVGYFKEIFDLAMVALMPLSFKLKKTLKKDIQSYIKELFHHEVLLTIKYSYSRYMPIVQLISEFEPGNRGNSYMQQAPVNCYYGEFKEGTNIKEGFGRALMDNGDKYEGYWKSDFINGQGIYIWKNKEWYRGEFIDGEITGNGVKQFMDNAKYEGNFFKGKMQGYGKMTFKNGDVFEGTWTQDCMNGNGEYYWSKSGERFKGIMKYDTRASGKIFDRDGNEVTS